MTKTVVRSSKKKAEKYDLTEYAFAKQVTKDLPKLLSMVNKLIPVLREYRRYSAVEELLSSAYDAQSILEIQLEYYEHILETKGKVND